MDGFPQNGGEGLDASAAYIASLLSSEEPGVKLGVGGYGMGAATALYFATFFAVAIPIKLSAVVVLNGWLPHSNNLNNRLLRVERAAERASSLPIFISHGKDNDVVPLISIEIALGPLKSAGFDNITFIAYDGLDHFRYPIRTHDMCQWIALKLT